VNDVIEQALRYRNLAEGVRINAASLQTEEARKISRKLAFDYDNLAETLEQAAQLMEPSLVARLPRAKQRS